MAHSGKHFQFLCRKGLSFCRVVLDVFCKKTHPLNCILYNQLCFVIESLIDNMLTLIK